jgi:hypothetical protein
MDFMMKTLMILFFCIFCLNAELSAQYLQGWTKVTSFPTDHQTTKGYKIYFEVPVSYVGVDYSAYSLWQSDGVSWIFMAYVNQEMMIDKNTLGGGTPAESLWELDANGNSRPKTTATTDLYWELDSYGNIRPK